MLIPISVFSDIIIYNALILILQSFLLFGQNRYVLKCYNEEDKAKVGTLVTFVIVIFSLLLTSICWFLIEEHLLLLLAASFGMMLNTLLSLVCRSTGDIKSFLNFRLLYTALRLTVIPGALIWNSSINSYFLAEICSALVPILFSLLRNRFSIKLLASGFKQVYSLGFNDFVKDVVSNLKFTLPIFFSFSSQVINQNIDKVVVGNSLNDIEVSSYGVLISFASSVTFIITFFAMKYEIMIYRSEDFVSAQNSINSFIKYSVSTALIFLPVIFGIYYLYCEYSKDISFSAELFFLLFICYFMNIFYFGFSYIITYLGKNLFILITVIFSVLINLACLHILVPIYGVYGAALSKFAFSAVLSILMYLFYLKLKSRVLEL